MTRPPRVAAKGAGGLRPASPFDAANDNETEKSFTLRVVALARECGWDAFHVGDGPLNRGGITSRGFPDLVLKNRRTGEMRVAELKTADGFVTAEQRSWLDAFAVYMPSEVWRPGDWDAIVASLGEVDPYAPAAPARGDYVLDGYGFQEWLQARIAVTDDPRDSVTLAQLYEAADRDFDVLNRDFPLHMDKIRYWVHRTFPKRFRGDVAVGARLV